MEKMVNVYFFGKKYSDGISNDAAPVTDQGTVEGDEEDGIPTDGWYTDEDGNTYYYQNGEKLQEVIVEIEDEDERGRTFSGTDEKVRGCA